MKQKELANHGLDEKFQKNSQDDGNSKKSRIVKRQYGTGSGRDWNYDGPRRHNSSIFD